MSEHTVLADGAILRRAHLNDMPQTLRRIRDLAAYEREPDAAGGRMDRVCAFLRWDG